MPGWIARLLSALEAAFELRLRRASGLDEPGAHAPEAEEEGEVEIVNLPPGSDLRR